VEEICGLKAVAARKRHANVLLHLMGFVKRAIDASDKDNCSA